MLTHDKLTTEQIKLKGASDCFQKDTSCYTLFHVPLDQSLKLIVSTVFNNLSDFKAVAVEEGTPVRLEYQQRAVICLKGNRLHLRDACLACCVQLQRDDLHQNQTNKQKHDEDMVKEYHRDPTVMEPVEQLLINYGGISL